MNKRLNKKGCLNMKKGFTLAEVLITLGIIGVVAALTAPALIQDAGSAQIGPKLAKAVSTFEVANENLLSNAGAGTILASGATSGSNSEMRNYGEALSNYMKISHFDDSKYSQDYKSMLKDYNKGAYNSASAPQFAQAGIKFAFGEQRGNGAKFLAKDGTLYIIGRGPFAQGATEPHNSKFAFVLIDINGMAKPNQIGRDAFGFALTSDGTLVPIGTQHKVFLPYDMNYHWQNGADKCNANEVTSGWTCAGSIFENNLKVIY